MNPARFFDLSVPRLLRALALFATLLTGAFGWVQPVGAAPATRAAQPELVLAVHKLVAAEGGSPEHLAPAESARIGDTLVYEATYRNPTSQTVRDAVITLPVPVNGVAYVLESASPALDQASADGRRFSAVPLMHNAPGADGKTVQRPAPATHYRYLRWHLGDLPAGSSRVVRARVQLVSGTAG